MVVVRKGFPTLNRALIAMTRDAQTLVPGTARDGDAGLTVEDIKNGTRRPGEQRLDGDFSIIPLRNHSAG